MYKEIPRFKSSAKCFRIDSFCSLDDMEGINGFIGVIGMTSKLVLASQVRQKQLLVLVSLLEGFCEDMIFQSSTCFGCAQFLAKPSLLKAFLLLQSSVVLLPS
eukprot:Gb_26562 [translate_table: standard]